MEIAAAIRVVFATIRQRPAQLFPFYLLALSVPAIVRVFSFIGVGLALGYLYIGGYLEAFQQELATIDTSPPDPETDPEAFLEWVEGLQPLAETIVTPTTVMLLAISILLSVIVMILLYAAVSAGQFGTCFGLLQGDNGIIRGIRGFRNYWLQFLGLYVLEFLLWVLITGSILTVILLSAAFSLTLALFVGIFAVLIWLGLAIAIRAVFVFAPVAVVVDDTSVTGSLRASVSFIRAEFGNAVIYYVIAIGTLLAWSGVSSTLATVGAPTVAALGSFLIIAPFLDLLKTVLFGDYRGEITPFESPDRSIIQQASTGTKRGVFTMGEFVRSTPGLHAVTLGIVLIGFWMGWVLIEPLTEYLEASIRARIAGIIPPSAALNFFTNNWMVGMTLAFSGLAFAIPTVAGLWFNGFVFGMYGHLEAEPLVLLAFVIPHGIFEIPAILISGALGLYLGLVFWRVWRGTIETEAFADILERAVWILVGIGVLIAIAAVIEGFFSPFYFRVFL